MRLWSSEIDAGLTDAFAHAERFCAHAAILLIHAPTAWPDDVAAYAVALAGRGVPAAQPGRLYGVDSIDYSISSRSPDGELGAHDSAEPSRASLPTLHIGWIGAI